MKITCHGENVYCLGKQFHVSDKKCSIKTRLHRQGRLTWPAELVVSIEFAVVCTYIIHYTLRSTLSFFEIKAIQTNLTVPTWVQKPVISHGRQCGSIWGTIEQPLCHYVFVQGGWIGTFLTSKFNILFFCDRSKIWYLK